MNIWSADNHLRHPWFDPIPKKRKHSPPTSSSSSADEWDGYGVDPQRTPKRRRCNILEQGFAYLSLHNETPHESATLAPEGKGDQGPSIAEILPETNPEEFAMDTADNAESAQSSPTTYSRGLILLPSSIEEPESDVPDIQMKTSSWYEPERDRIVITDLDAFESEDDEEPSAETQGDRPGISINTSLLEHIKRQRPSMTSNTSTNQALILYRPLAVPDTPPPENPLKSGKGPDANAIRAGDLETGAIDIGNEMEVEPMDIEFL